MSEIFELFKGTFHDTNVGTRARVISELPEEIPPLRADVARREIGKVATTQGLMNVVEIEFGGLDKESVKSLDRIKSISHKLGETATPLIVVSTFAAMAVALLETDPNPPVRFGWPAKLERDETGRILYANQIATPPSTPSLRRPNLSQQTLAHYRREYLLDEEATPRPIINLSPDQLTINEQPLEQRKILEPYYPFETIGTTQYSDVDIVHQQRGMFPPYSHVSLDCLNVVHSGTLLAMQLAEDLPFGYFEASSTVMAQVGRNPKTGEQTSEISEFAVFGPKTIEDFAKRL